MTILAILRYLAAIYVSSVAPPCPAEYALSQEALGKATRFLIAAAVFDAFALSAITVSHFA